MTTTTTAMHPTHSATTMSSVVWDATVIDPRLSDRLVLKTKIYQSTQQQPLSSSLISEDRHQENENSNNDDIEQSQSTPPFSSSTHDTLSPPPSTPTETEPTATPSSAWSFPNLLFSRDRDAATLEEMDDEMEHGIRCAICLIRLQDGDAIGDITCGHAFHKDCLKDWLKRKNRCPLCQQTGVAKLYQELLHTDNSGNNYTHNNNNHRHNPPSTRTTSSSSANNTFTTAAATAIPENENDEQYVALPMQHLFS
jgi:hypothetical protein